MQEWTLGLTEFGLIKAPFGEEWGGFGMDWLTHLMVFEEIAYTSLDIAIPGFINAVNAELLSQLAPEAFKEKYLADIINCDKFIAMGISEPDVGSDVSAVKTRAVLDGDHWVINGERPGLPTASIQTCSSVPVAPVRTRSAIY